MRKLYFSPIDQKKFFQWKQWGMTHIFIEGLCIRWLWCCIQLDGPPLIRLTLPQTVFVFITLVVGMKLATLA